MIGTSATTATIPMFIFILVFIGFAVLQVFLSKLKNKRIGLILPVLASIPAVFATIGGLFYGNAPIIVLIILFVAMEIPALIFLAIYYIVRVVCKDKLKEDPTELEKMNIQDL